MTCKEYLDSKGVDLIPSTRGWKCVCPVPSHDDHDPSCYIYEDGDQQNWFCFGCRCSGRATDVYGLVMAVEQCSFPEAVEIVGEPPAVREYRKTTEGERMLLSLTSEEVGMYTMGRIRGQLMSGTIPFEVAEHW